MITVRQVQDACCKYFDITRDQLLQLCRLRKFARPRQIAMYLARELTGKTLQQIGTAFCRDHTTIMCAIEIGPLLEQDPDFGPAIADIRKGLKDPVYAQRRELELSMKREWKNSVPRCYAPGAYADEALATSFLEAAE